MSFLSVLSIRNMRARGEISDHMAFRMHWMMHRVRKQTGESPLPAHMAERLEELRARARGRAALEANAVEGLAYLIFTEMDCDCVRFTHRKQIPADLDSLNAALEEVYEGAEGPVTWAFCTREEFWGFKRESRDLALEAHENGHPHRVYA